MTHIPAMKMHSPTATAMHKIRIAVKPAHISMVHSIIYQLSRASLYGNNCADCIACCGDDMKFQSK